MARLGLLLEATPELHRPMATFENRYQQRLGEDFRQRRTLVRIALASGYVDEGLWGLQSQSHYEVQGAPWCSLRGSRRVKEPSVP